LSESGFERTMVSFCYGSTEMKVWRQRSVYVLAVLLVVVSFAIDSDTARGDWLKKAKELFKGKTDSGQLTTQDIGAGLKDALRIGTENVVGKLGQSNGFNGDPSIHIPLPESLEKVQSKLRKVGLSSLLDDLELRLNRAAERATPKAKALFWQAINDMTLDDVKGIYKGPDDAATRYFRGRMSAPLAAEMHPIVDSSLAEVGAVQAFDNVMEKYRALPFAPKIDADLTTFVIEKGMDGIFYYLAREEAEIRKDPVKQTTDLLRRVFGKQS
jgi:hypothetical protein